MDSPNPPTQIPNSVRPVPGSNQSYADSIISSLLLFPDSSPTSISSSFDRVLDKALASASVDESVQDRLVDRTLELASLLLDSTKRCFRKRASVHNSNSWFLPPELTIKVFSMLDTKSLMQASVCCTMFNNCAIDRVCYSHIDLTTAARYADKGIVSTVINRAGRELRSLKIGRVVRAAGSDSPTPLLSGSCLSTLAYNHGFLGSRLRNLRLYNLRPIKYRSLCNALSVCPNITDLRIVGLYNLTEELFNSLTIKCRFIEHLFLETYGYPRTLETKTGSSLIDFVANCPNLTSLTLIRFGLTDEWARNLVESSRKLKYLNLARSPTIKGRFLRELGLSCKDPPLKTLILRNCPKLQEKEVLEFCNSILAGNFKSIRHIDVSSNRGLVSSVRGKRCNKPTFPLERLKEEKSDVTFVAEFPMTSSKKLYDDEELRLIEMMDADDDEVDDDDDSDDDSEDGSDEDESDDDVGMGFHEEYLL
ncbi:PREDICTED: F-box protein SKIP17 isoform X1 [Camelina sativa]|uniref:F-box protein SKIP17 isoform X1 n=1 Tax=Camelina sativa TaxID=90675 RepID=A0ABM0VGR8_CAMSA|nr:PREDICTED: F-box protein SKIP17 isoform X1 [Camelina sativa]